MMAYQSYVNELNDAAARADHAGEQALERGEHKLADSHFLDADKMREKARKIMEGKQ